jgi:hypothetical protein
MRIQKAALRQDIVGRAKRRHGETCLVQHLREARRTEAAIFDREYKNVHVGTYVM